LQRARSSLQKATVWLIPAVAAWMWFCTVANRSAEQVMSLDNVEGYALAVFTQLFWIWNEHGEWAQTIHYGYVDSWMWSGHRVGWLPMVGWMFGMNPDPVWLCRIQIGAVALGAFPAFGLGRLLVGGIWGGLAGLVLYLGFPPLSAIALQDYQDLVLAIPFLLLTIYLARLRMPIPFAVAALCACMVREEVIPMVVLVGLGVPGSWRQRLAWVSRAGVVAVVYGAIIWWLGRDFSGYDNPMLSHTGDMLVRWPPVFSRSMDDLQNFYLNFLKPVQFLALLSPLTVLPAAGALFFHLTAPTHGGVDVTWGGHIHHMAPVVAFVVAASIDGLGRLVRFSGRLGRLRTPILILGAGAGLWATITLASPWMRFLHLSPAVTLTTPGEAAPEWALIDKLPKDARVATDTRMSLVIARRRYAYTYDESLPEKRPNEGLDAVDYILVRKRDRDWVALIEQAPGAIPVDTTKDYTLYHLQR
jgi:uncharacterized membrane protein